MVRWGQVHEKIMQIHNISSKAYTKNKNAEKKAVHSCDGIIE